MSARAGEAATESRGERERTAVVGAAAIAMVVAAVAACGRSDGEREALVQRNSALIAFTAELEDWVQDTDGLRDDEFVAEVTARMDEYPVQHALVGSSGGVVEWDVEFVGAGGFDGGAWADTTGVQTCARATLDRSTTPAVTLEGVPCPAAWKQSGVTEHPLPVQPTAT